MKKTYVYENAIVNVRVSDNKRPQHIHKATENFLKKVLKERITNGNNSTSTDISKE